MKTRRQRARLSQSGINGLMLYTHSSATPSPAVFIDDVGDRSASQVYFMPPLIPRVNGDAVGTMSNCQSGGVVH